MRTDAIDNELTPGEFGLLAGNAWGTASGAGLENPTPGETPMLPMGLLDTTFRAGVAARMAEFPDAAEAESAFWHAFVSGFELSSARTWRGSLGGANRESAVFCAPIRR